MSQFCGNFPCQQAEVSYPLQHAQPQNGYGHQQRVFHDHPSYPHSQQSSPSPYTEPCHCPNCSNHGQDHPYPPYAHIGENSSYYNESPLSQQQLGTQEGEKGLGSTVVGGAAGGYAAHQLGGGKLATAGGAVLGAVGMNMVNHKLNKPNPPVQPATVVQPAGVPGTATVIAVPADGGLGLGSGLGVGRLGRAHRLMGRRRLGLY